MNKLVIGILTNRTDAEGAIESLKIEGFNPKDFSIIMRDKEESKEIEKGTGVKVSEGAVAGATTGGLIGAAAGLLIGIGAIAVPGVGAVLIGGPIAAALGLSGAAASTVSGAVTGMLAGGLVGALVRLGIPEPQARIYEQRIREGGILLAVPTGSTNEARVREVLEMHDASEISTITSFDNKEDKAMANPFTVQKYLEDVDYPATKEELLGYAIKNGADESVRSALQRMHSRRYRSPKDVNEELSKVK